MTEHEKDPTDWTVDAPAEADFPAWRQLYQGYADFYRTPLPDENADRVWSWLMDPEHEVRGLLVRGEDGVPVGLAHYRPFARPLHTSIGGFLDDLYVDPEARGSGAVDALFGRLREITAEQGWSVLRWITAEDNYRARAKYDQVAKETSWVTYDLTPGG
ncbi:GNAT family N-acetyltransferase [Streptomyces sp. A7024]|uniref:GNAT family N-acetyltransferase n=1 Tax=Streptomyces coryli TaxID=1128680 RepID=A0A6G4U6K8_9ACTN|nr:GNAT family N-acetyltransferase [Streptomyces coryli]NGN67346.1 GNAT family N-acetyltransferase [Streptomyces coryli]